MDKRILATLRVTPMLSAGEVWTYRFTERAGDYWIDVRQRGYVAKPARRRVAVASAEAEAWLAQLRSATVPVYPVSPAVLDGEYLELTIAGEFAELCLSWWTVAPRDSEILEQFARWLRAETART